MPKPEDGKDCKFCEKPLLDKPVGAEDKEAGLWGKLSWDEYTGKGNEYITLKWKLHRYCFKKIKPFLVSKFGRPIKDGEK